jgi:hypothetical protein
MGLEGINPNILLAAGLALAALVLLRKSRGLFGAKIEPSDSPRKDLFTARQRESALDDAPLEVLRWQVEMHQTARDLKAEIDTKLVALQATTRLAHEACQRLEAAIDRARRMGVDAGDALTAIENLADDPAAAAALPPLAPPRPLPLDERGMRAIRELAAGGHSAASIAQRLSLPVGDVEIALHL